MRAHCGAQMQWRVSKVAGSGSKAKDFGARELLLRQEIKYCEIFYCAPISVQR